MTGRVQPLTCAVLFCLTLQPAWPQFKDLAATDDGLQLYFASPLALKGANEYDSYKIFRYVDSHFELFAQVKPSAPAPDGSGTFYFALGAPQVTGDGRIVTYDGTSTCTGTGLCVGSFKVRGTIVGAILSPGNINAWGSLRVSRDGRSVLWFYNSSPGGDPKLFDLATHTETVLTGHTVIGDGIQAVGQNRTVLLDHFAPVLWRNGQVQSLQFSHAPLAARLSNDNTTIVYESALPGTSYSLFAYDVASGRETLLAEGPVAPPWFPFHIGPPFPDPFFHPSISNDGKLVLFRLPDPAGIPQLAIENTDGSGRRILTNVAGGVTEGVLSGYGNSAYAATANGALLRIDVMSGDTQILAPESVQVTKVTGAFVPGAIVQLDGHGLIDSDGHRQVQADGLNLADAGGNANSLLLQVPWELPLSHPAVVRAARADSPFEQVLTFQPRVAAPLFYSALDPQEQLLDPAVLHQDFHALVTGYDPAVPGEIVHLYLTGLGPVDRPIPTGAVTPGGKIFRATTPLECRITELVPGDGTNDVPVEILFAGLAPGFVGLNQMDVRLPSTVVVSHPGQSDADALTCTAGSPPDTESRGTVIFVGGK